MKRVAVLACAAALVSVPAAFSSVRASYPPLLGTTFSHGAIRLVWLDPLTLKVRGTRSLKLPGFTAWRQSPDGSELVFVSDPGRLQFVDAKRLRPAGSVRLPGMIQSDAVWASSRLLFVYDTIEIAAVDPVARKVLWRERVPHAFNPFYPEGAAATLDGMVILLSPADGSVGPTSVLSVDSAGQIRTAVLTQIQSGEAQDRSGASVFNGASPGLAVDVADGRAYVTGAGTIAEVDLGTLAVTYHDHARRLEVAQKALSGPTRTALWLGNGLLAVTGENDRAWIDAHGTYHEVVKPAGLTIVDTRTWTTTLIDPSASHVTFADGLLLASGQSWEATGAAILKSAGTGLTAYSPSGTAAFHLLGKTVVQSALAVNRLGYAWTLTPKVKNGQTATVFDLATGRVLRTVAKRLGAGVAWPLTAY